MRGAGKPAGRRLAPRKIMRSFPRPPGFPRPSHETTYWKDRQMDRLRYDLHGARPTYRVARRGVAFPIGQATPQQRQGRHTTPWAGVRRPEGF